MIKGENGQMVPFLTANGIPVYASDGMLITESVLS
jgi:hypothetical protein